MVRHQAIRQHRHRDRDTRMPHGFAKGLIVTVLAEDLPTIVAAIDRVIAKSADRGSHCARMLHRLRRARASVNNKRARSLFPFGDFGLGKDCVAQAEAISLIDKDELDLERGLLLPLMKKRCATFGVKAISYVIEADCEPDCE